MHSSSLFALYLLDLFLPLNVELYLLLNGFFSLAYLYQLVLKNSINELV